MVSLLFFIAFAVTFNTVLGRSVKITLSSFWTWGEKAFSLASLSMLLALVLFYFFSKHPKSVWGSSFIFISCWNVFLLTKCRCWVLSTFFLHLQKWSYVLFIDMVSYIDWLFCMLKKSCLLGINSTWSWCFIFFILLDSNG